MTETVKTCDESSGKSQRIPTVRDRLPANQEHKNTVITRKTKIRIRESRIRRKTGPKILTRKPTGKLFVYKIRISLGRRAGDRQQWMAGKEKRG